MLILFRLHVVIGICGWIDAVYKAGPILRAHAAEARHFKVNIPFVGGVLGRFGEPPIGLGGCGSYQVPLAREAMESVNTFVIFALGTIGSDFMLGKVRAEKRQHGVALISAQEVAARVFGY